MTPSVLVIDDDVAICRILQLMLSNEAYEIKTCHSVSEAISAIEEKVFTVYVVDWKLSDGSGFDVASAVRLKWGKMPIILISGYDRSVTASKAEELGITEFIEKPFSRETFCSAVKKGVELAASAVVVNPPSEVVELKRKSIVSRIFSRF